MFDSTTTPGVPVYYNEQDSSGVEELSERLDLRYDGKYLIHHFPKEIEEVQRILRNAFPLYLNMFFIAFRALFLKCKDILKDVPIPIPPMRSLLEMVEVPQKYDPSWYKNVENLSDLEFTNHSYKIDWKEVPADILYAIRKLIWENRPLDDNGLCKSLMFIVDIPQEQYLDLSKEYTFEGKPAFALELNPRTHQVRFSYMKKKTVSEWKLALPNGAVTYSAYDLWVNGSKGWLEEENADV